MASNDQKNPDVVTNSESGRPEPAPGSNDSSHTFTDMPGAPESENNKEDPKVDISSADDVDVDKDTPVEEDDTRGTPPDPARGGDKPI